MLTPYASIDLLLDEIEEELGPLEEALDTNPPETYESQLKRMKEATSQISWLKILGIRINCFTCFIPADLI